MILDTIKKFHAQFGNMNEEDALLLGIEPKIAVPQKLKGQLLAGKWSALHFSIWNDLDTAVGLKIVPNLDGRSWPVYWLFPEGTMRSSRLDTYLPFIHSEVLFSFPSSGKKYLDTWQHRYELLLPVQELFGGTSTDFDELRDIVFNKNQWAKGGKQYGKVPDKATVDARYRKFWLERDKSTGCRYLFDLLDKVSTDDKYLPELASPNLGVYEPRVKMIIAMRANKLGIDINRMLDGLMMPHGFDSEDIFPKYIPAYNLDRHLLALAERVGLDYENEEDWKTIPEMMAFKIITDQMNGDSGMAFLEAASIRDEKFKQPILAWNNLVSAGFWTGINMGNTKKCIKAQAVIVKAAIHLCKKNKWVEAEEVLKYNLDIMQSV